MKYIGFAYGDLCFYWSDMIPVMAALAAALFFVGTYLRRGGEPGAGMLFPLQAMILSVLLARLIHWYCRAGRYASLAHAMRDPSGGYALLGVFLGCGLTAVLLRLSGRIRNLPRLLDCLCLAGSLGIALGRLNSFFDNSDRGQIVAGIRSLPWVYPVSNAASSAPEYRLATFALQSLVCLLLFLGLNLYARSRRCRQRDGDIALLFLLIYSASQVILDSTRYDSLFFRSNGFVSIVQVAGALTLAAVLVIFTVGILRRGVFRPVHIFLWLAALACMGGTGYMEYYVQRHGNQAAFAYSVMAACLTGLVAAGLALYSGYSSCTPPEEAVRPC